MRAKLQAELMVEGEAASGLRAKLQAGLTVEGEVASGLKMKHKRSSRLIMKQ